MKHEIPGLRLGENWTSAVAALEGILNYLGQPLPRHALMGLTGHAWHACLATRDEVTALPSGPADLDWQAMVERYARAGYRWERFGGELPAGAPWDEMRSAAVDWATAHLDAGRPLIGWDFHLHEHGIVFGYDRDRAGFLVHDMLTPELGPFVLWDVWPTAATSRLELFAPVEQSELDPLETIAAALRTALDCFEGNDGPADGQPRGTAALDAWAAAFDGETEVDRAGNAYTLVVLQAARMDGAAFLADVAESIPDLAEPLLSAEKAIREQVKALAPLITLFPFPSGGHGNVNNPGLRRAAAMALRRAANHERDAAEGIHEALAMFAGKGAHSARIAPVKNYPVSPNLSTPRGYSHVVSASGSRTVYVAGQISTDTNGNIVGAGDLRAQTTQVLENVKAALAAAGATFADVVKQNTYVVNLNAEALPIIREVRSIYFPAENPPASTLVGVTALAFPELLIEVEVVAVID